ncbi:MAG: hypothetical protein KC493_17395 [Bacteriovoracaceae bacterium]|nr:hypothetical protein [Bacteriovoracaceae bacterium]
MKILQTLILFLIMTPSLANAKSGKGNLLVQPIVGIETVKKWDPTVRTVTRTVVGARAVYGPPLISAEAEVTRSQDDEYLFETDLKVEEETYAAKLGIRSSFRLVSMLRFYIRGGGQARQRKITETQAGVVTTKEPAIRTSPYAGAGLSVNLMGFFVNAGYTAIFTGKPKGSDYETQTTLGIGARF